jgi:hypothetical protein
MRDEVKEEFQMVNSFAVNKDDILLTRSQKRLKKTKDLGVTEKVNEPIIKSHKERLIELKELLENGLITEVEYESKRSHILNDI